MFIDSLFIPYAIILIVLSILFLGSNIFQRFQGNVASQIITLVLGILPVLYFFIFLAIHIVDIPFSDDYNLLDSFIRLLHTSTIETRMSVLFEQVNQHRFAFERIVMYLLYAISGDFSTKTHILLGNISLIGITCLFYQYFKTKSYPLHYFLPVPLTVFSLVFYENATWSIAALQNTPILFFAILTTYLLAKPTRFGWALLAAIVTTFISGNGISIWIVGVIILLLQGKNKRLIGWLFTAIVTACFYFLYDYHFYKSEGASIWDSPLMNILMVSAFWGNIFYADYSHFDTRKVYPDVLLSVISGITFLGITLLTIFKNTIDHKYNRQPEKWIVVGAMLFVLATGSMLVISRPTTWNILQGSDVFSRRYMIFGMVIAVASYLALIDLLSDRKLLVKYLALSTTLLAILGNLGTYYFFAPKVITAHQELALDTFYIQHHGTLLSVGEVYGEKPFWNHPSTFLNLVKRADSLSLFSHPSPKKWESLLAKVPQKDKAISQLRLWTTQERIGKLTGGFSIHESLLLEYNPTVKQNITYFLFKSKQHQFIVPAVRQNIPVKSVNDLFRQAYSYSYRTEKFPANTYQVSVVAETGDAYQVFDLERSIIIRH